MSAEIVPQLLDKEASSRIAARQETGNPLGVCILSADFWGLKAAGGTATAYHLLAAVLARDVRLNVSQFKRFPQALRFRRKSLVPLGP